ncbi:hypothetical protein K443DRAFT_15430 [Laccaria amethystina LaAM-08-1]|uniref:Uncharacterized protein n=1 Tax=Laccaria amethystina LaAM-08-1 TaxID=1095629 RepID=A0A0C9X0W3_9AGAR|nr:hypothetical protein K443DRAFT_15430 [Laccaria amethystina LaAM-08-1]
MEHTKSFSPLTLRTIFADEPLRTVHQLSMRRTWPTWPFESEAIPLISQVHSKALIPKPSGELGRPGRNGYSLSAALGWEMFVYKKVQTRAREEVNSILKKGAPFNAQDRERVKSVCDKLREEFPILNRYEGDWAALDFVRSCLRNAPCYRERRL